MNILGLETSTTVCSVGLIRNGRPAIEQSVRESHIHSEKLLTLVQDVMRSAGLQLNELNAIAVSIGPGSFTGLRIGLSTAKGLSFALEKPLVAIPTFEAIALAAGKHHSGAGPITVLLDAKKGEWYSGHFAVADGRIVALGAVEVGTREGAIARTRRNNPGLVVTDMVEDLSRTLDFAATIEDVHKYCRGDVVAVVAQSRVLNGEFSDPAALEPMYLKDFVVKTPGNQN